MVSLLQRVFESKPAGIVNNIIGLLSDTPLPSAVLRPAIKAYSLGFGVDMDGVVKPPGGFSTFGDYFARRLEPYKRVISQDKDAVVSASDGKITCFGKIENTPRTSFSVKSSCYDVNSLIGRSMDADDIYVGGGYMVTYLHPRDYHWVHSPVDGHLLRVRHIPGARFPVAAWSETRISDIFGKNERLVFDIETKGKKQLSIVMVAAFGVSNMATEYGPSILAEEMTVREFESPIALSRGSDLGAFRLGSTVVMLWQKDAIVLNDDVSSGRVIMGELLGKNV